MNTTAIQLAPSPRGTALPQGRSPLAHLLHALNQPLTGLQCSLELAASGPRPTEQYVRTLRDGLELTNRMRMLVEALRELADLQSANADRAEAFPLDALLLDAVDELQPVAEARAVRVQVSVGDPLPVRADRPRLVSLLFRLLASALSLCREESDLKLVAGPQGDRACVTFSWRAGKVPEHSPFSRQELGLLIARAAWEQEGGEWTEDRTGSRESILLRLRMVSGPSPEEIGDLK
jgi:signal transduction histidine kinase